MLDETIYYTTPPIMLGKHEGVLDVYQTEFYGRCTRHRWPRVGDVRWRKDEEWPTYDTHHGYFGQPKGLARHFHLHRAAIEQALGISTQNEWF
jgi:hypothetical protein